MTKWQVRFDEDKAVFRKPLAERLWHGAFAFGLTFVWAILVFPRHKSPVAHDADLVSNFALIALILLTSGFGAGPKEMLFDFKHQQYKWRMGFPLFSWTHAGDFSEIKSLSVWNLSNFTGLGVEWKNSKRTAITFASCPTGREAQALAEHLGSKVGVPAEKGVVRGLKKSAKL